MSNFYKKYLLYYLLISIIFFACSETNPSVKIQNNSEKIISVYFKDNTCINCPSITFLNIDPFSETEYKTCSVKDYSFSVITEGEEIISDVIFKPNYDVNYIIIISKDFKCDIKSFDK